VPTNRAAGASYICNPVRSRVRLVLMVTQLMMPQEAVAAMDGGKMAALLATAAALMLLLPLVLPPLQPPPAQLLLVPVVMLLLVASLAFCPTQAARVASRSITNRHTEPEVLLLD
jgi:hypothetical protein